MTKAHEASRSCVSVNTDIRLGQRYIYYWFPILHRMNDQAQDMDGVGP